MKIAWLTNNINQLGGVEQVICGLSSYFSGTLHHKVSIISIHSSESCIRYTLDSSVSVQHCGIDWRDLNFYQLSKRIGEIIVQLDADILLTCHSTISLAVILNKRKFSGKIVVTQHTTCDSYSKKRLYCNAALLRFADQFVVLTESDRVQYQKMGCRSMVIPNAIFVPTTKKSSLNQPIILAAGRFEVEKGFDRLVDAFSRISKNHPEWKLCICGSGTLENQIKEQIEQLGLSKSVVLPGSVSNIQDYYQNASIFALSSREEGLALVLLEAIAFGLPIVSFDLPCTREVLGNGSLIAAQGDVISFAEKLELLISDVALRKKVGDEAFVTSQKYTIPAISEQWMQLFNKLLSE